MRAITVTEPGGPEALQWTEVPDPVAKPGEVVVEVVAGSGHSWFREDFPAFLRRVESWAEEPVAAQG